MSFLGSRSRMPVDRDLERAYRPGFRSGPSHYHLGVVSLMVAVCMGSPGCSSKPDGVDVNPITSLRFTAGPDFFDRIQRQLGGRAADWSKNGVGYLVFRLPNPDPDVPIYRDLNVFREDSLPKIQEIYAHQRQQFTSSDSGNNWKLYREKGDATEKWFISYQGTRLDTNHGVPMGVITKPEVFIGILKQNVFIVISYTAYASDSNYIQTINQDIRFVADVLSKAAS